MNRIQWTVLTGLLLSATQLGQAASPDYFHLEPGSVRVYRAQNSEATISLRMGSIGYMHSDHVHYPVTGYVDRSLLLYRDERTGTLYDLDPETGLDKQVMAFDTTNPYWFPVPDRPCDQEARINEALIPYNGPAGAFENSLLVAYRSYGCADAGVLSERYVENIGLVQRTIQSLAGPVQYDLVYATLGPITITEMPAASFSVGVRQQTGPVAIADLRWASPRGDLTVLQLPSTQEYEVVLRNVNGDVLWRWSDGKFFEQQVQNRAVRFLNYSVEIPLQFNGILLPEGVYTVEAWLATGAERRYASAVNFVWTYPETGRRTR